MRGTKGVVFGFAALGKARHTAKLPERAHAGLAPGQYFVRIRLVTHIPNNAVVRCVVDIMQCNGEFDRTQI